MADPRRRKSKAIQGWRGAAATTASLVRRAGWRRSLISTVLLCAFASGFYIAQLYSEISALIEERRAALTSSIYSAPLVISPGDEVAQLHLVDRLDHLSYTRVENPAHPGQYSMVPGAMTINVRDFRIGSRGFPATFLHLTFDGSRVSGIADSFGVAMPAAMIEPEVVGRLMPDMPAERAEVSLSEMPPYLPKGLLATEDRFFYYHAHRLRQGASTLTQQLARTFIEKHTRTFSRKLRELSIAIVLEMRLTKNEILERYINDVPMGDYDGTPIYGLPLAARYFFNKDLREVTPAEAATLIGMIQAPSLYSAVRHADACRARRDVVLAVMLHAHVLDQAQYADAAAQPIAVAKAPGLRRAPYFADYVRSLLAKLPGFDGNLKGVKVYTTLDPETQEAARQSVVDNLKHLEHDHPHLRRHSDEDRLESSLVALDPRTGAIVAMVGGRDYSASQFNRAANAERQVGSAFKP